MLNKIFLGLVAVSVAVIGAICYYAYSWLGSIGNPEISAEGYIYNSTLGWTLLWVTFLILAITSLFSLWQSRATWPLWVTFAYFGLFSLLLMLIDSSFSDFLERNSLSTEYTLLNPFLLAVLLVVLLIGGLAAQMLTVKVRVKVKKEESAPVEEAPVEEATGKDEKPED